MQQPQEVLKATLQNAVTSTDQQLVCTMAMVCRDWRAATQAGPAGLLHVTLDLEKSWAPATDGLPSESMQKLASFSQWLPKHAGMVSGITVSGTRSKETAGFETIAAATFSLALRSAATATAASGAALRPLCLQSYTSNILHSNAVLQALPTTNLKQLTITNADLTTAAAALPLLTNLQTLATPGFLSGDEHLFVAAIGQISTLTSLEGCSINSCDAKLLPVQLIALELSILDSCDGLVNLLHLTKLTRLKFHSQFGRTTACISRLPAQIIQLAIKEFGKTKSSVYSRFALSSLTQLTTLTIDPSIQTSEELLQLGALPALQDLSLWYYNADVALAAAPAWVQLRQLHSIGISSTPGSPSLCADLCSRLSSLTRLTRLKLRLHFHLKYDTEQQAPPLAICGNLTTLRMLQDLVLGVADASGGQVVWAQGDISQLSCLTRLTKLDLYTQNLSQEVFSDATVVQLLRGLKRLQELAVSVKSDTVLTVIADLKDLKMLQICGMPEKAQQSGLQYLRGLKNLTRLYGFWACSKEALADFWAAVRA